MIVNETEAKSILRKHDRIDSWFLSYYGMNLYRGCAHNCVYCDGRAEGYYVEGEFGESVSVKTNAQEVLRRELDPRRKRTPFKRGYVLLGGGVGDSYQPVEKRYTLARQALELLYEGKFPVHVLTKSTLVKRDLDILERINAGSRAIVSFSFSSTSDVVSATVEPGVPPPSQRLETMGLFKKAGIACGAFLMPVIPYLTDTQEVLEESVRALREAGVDFIVFGGMTLKEGRQKEHFLSTISRSYPDIADRCRGIYRLSSKWGEPAHDYAAVINRRFYQIAQKQKVPTRIPPRLWQDILDIDDRISVTLEHIDYLLKMRGEPSSFGYSAYRLSQMPVPAADLKERPADFERIDKKARAVMLEIIETGRSLYYEQLLGV